MTGLSDIPLCMKTCAMDAQYASWFPLIGVILITVVFGISLVFMISRVLGKREWEALARAELYQAGIAAVWVLIIASAATVTCSTSCSITGDSNPFETAITYISDVRSGLQSNSMQFFDIAKDVRVKSALSFALPGGTYLSPWSGCDSVAGNYETFATILAPIIGSLLIQQDALIMVSNIAFQFLLPLGIVLRLIPFLRESGAFVIAMAFALYIVLPLTYVMADKAMAGIGFGTIGTHHGGRDCVDPSGSFNKMKTIGTALPQAIFFPALSSIITIAAAKSLAKVFRYDFQEIL